MMKPTEKLDILSSTATIRTAASYLSTGADMAVVMVPSSGQGSSGLGPSISINFDFGAPDPTQVARAPHSASRLRCPILNQSGFELPDHLCRFAS